MHRALVVETGMGTMHRAPTTDTCTKKKQRTLQFSASSLIRSIFPQALLDVKIRALTENSVEFRVTAQFNKFDSLGYILSSTEFT